MGWGQLGKRCRFRVRVHSVLLSVVLEFLVCGLRFGLQYLWFQLQDKVCDLSSIVQGSKTSLYGSGVRT